MLKAAAWALGGNISSQLLRLISNLILTRLLVPEAFGLVAAVNTLYFALIMLSDLGMYQSVVRSPHGADPRFLGTAWVMQGLRGILLAALVLLISRSLDLAAEAGAFSAGTVYADPRLPPMMAVFALCALMQGLESMKLASAERELQVGYLTRFELASQFGAMVATLALTWATRSVWSLLLGSLVGSALRLTLSYLYLPGRNDRPCWDQRHAQELFGFGKWVFLSSITGFLAANGEKIILGGSLSISSFGVFSIASTLLSAMIGVYNNLNAKVIFSGLSLTIRDADRAQLLRAYTGLQRYADLFLGTLAGGLLMSGQWAVWLLYDVRYHDAGWMLQWLGFGLLAMRTQIVEQLMFALGQPAWVSGNNGLRAISLAVLIPAGFAVSGEPGAIVAVVVSQFASWPLSLRFKYQEGLLCWATEKWWLPALGAGVMLGWLLDSLLSQWFLPS